MWACELGCRCVLCGICALLRLWCRVALCSLNNNSIGPEGAAAISRGLASVPQLLTLKYVVAVCVRWWCGCGSGTLWRKACEAGVPVCGQSAWA